MQTYTITFYPGMVLPRPYYVTVDNKTTDYQALMDILADRLSEEGADGLFDDNNEMPDDEVTICGNESRRLIAGGQLNIQEFSIDDMLVLLNDKLSGTKPVSGRVDIGFTNDEGNEDETSFDVKNKVELAELWMNFCDENNFDITSIECVTIFGWQYFEMDITAIEKGKINVKIPYGEEYSKEELEELAREQEKEGFAVFNTREIVFDMTDKAAKSESVFLLYSCDSWKSRSSQSVVCTCTDEKDILQNLKEMIRNDECSYYDEDLSPKEQYDKLMEDYSKYGLNYLNNMLKYTYVEIFRNGVL